VGIQSAHATLAVDAILARRTNSLADIAFANHCHAIIATVVIGALSVKCVRHAGDDVRVATASVTWAHRNAKSAQPMMRRNGGGGKIE
jgi:hypothetical protein